MRPPFILGLEFAGIVIEAPPGADFRKGDAVFGDYSGSFSEIISIPKEQISSLQLVPEGWPVEAAAGLAATLPVSYDGLVSAGRMRSGETVLVHAAAGGLGVMACQIAAAKGCRVIATAGSDAKCAYAKGYGASECINYSTNKEWWKRVNEITEGKGVNVVFDPVGLVEPSLKCMASKGRIVVVGFAGTADNFEKIAMNRILLKQVELIGYVSLFTSHARNTADSTALWPIAEREPGEARGDMGAALPYARVHECQARAVRHVRGLGKRAAGFERYFRKENFRQGDNKTCAGRWHLAPITADTFCIGTALEYIFLLKIQCLQLHIYVSPRAPESESCLPCPSFFDSLHAQKTRNLWFRLPGCKTKETA